MTDVTIGIVNWNTKDLLKDCLESILQQTHAVDYQVWVVDNASSDGSVHMVEKDFPEVHLIKSPNNLGFSRANNRILRDCNSKYALLLNSDTRIVGNAVKDLFYFMEANPDTGVAGCQILNEDGSLQLSCGRFPRLSSIFFGGITVNRIFKKLFRDKTFFAEYGLTEQDHLAFQDVDFVKGCCLMLRKDVLHKAGFLDENIFMYFEEIDLCYRIKQQGKRVLYTPEPKIIHLVGQSNKAVAKTIYYRLESQEYFFRKHYGIPHARAMKWIITLGACIRFPLFLIMYGLWKDKDRPFLKSKIVWDLNVFKWLLGTLGREAIKSTRGWSI